MTSSLLISDLDTSVSPKQDFYRFANGGWLKRNECPPKDFSRYGTFEDVAECARDNLRAIVEAVEKEAVSEDASDDVKQVGDMYASAMNTELCEETGLQSLMCLRDTIEAVDGAAAFMTCVTNMHTHSIYACLNWSAEPDSKNSSFTLMHLFQGGLGLPDRDYYFDEQHKTILTKYEKHIARVLVLGGVASAVDCAHKAQGIIALESALADASLTRVQRRDPHKTYNKISVHQLDACIWLPFFNTIGLPIEFEHSELIVENPAFLRKLETMISDDTLLPSWKFYLHWNLLRYSSPFLGSQFEALHFDFFGRTLTGQQEQKPRWKRVLAVIGTCLETPLAKLYVSKHFKQEAKEQCLEMVDLLRNALKESILSLEWMGEETKIKALEKLQSFKVKIGYPDEWENFSDVIIDRNASYIVNKWSGAKAATRREIARINKPVNIHRWEMPPQTVNAYFHPQMNEIVFPAAILQPPFFIAPSELIPLGDAAVSFGAIGAVIGHEMTHGYDDSGRQYNSEGNLVDWWSEADAAAFTERAAVIIQQFAEYKVLGKKVNGKLTQGENIADLGGLKIAYKALQSLWASNTTHNNASCGRSAVDGYTGEQRFFLSWARVWRHTIRDEEALKRLVVDPHAPGRYRVNGPLVHLDEFHKAFGVTQGDEMFRDANERCNIW